MQRGGRGRTVLRRVVARASFSGLGHEKLRELGLQGRIWFLPVFSFGLRFGKRATARTCTTSLTETRFWGRGLQRNLAKEKARVPSRRRGNTKRNIRRTLQPFSFCLGRNLECRSCCAGISLEGVGTTTLATSAVLVTEVHSRGAQPWGGSCGCGSDLFRCRFSTFVPKKVCRGRGLEEVPLRPVGSALGVCTAGPYTRLFHNLERSKLARLVYSKTLSAEQHCSHVVEAVRTVQLKLAKVRNRPVRTRLCLQSAKDLVRVSLLYEQRADRALKGVVVWVGVRPGEAVAMQVFGGQECLEPLFLICSPTRRWPVLRLGWFGLRSWLIPEFGGQVALRLMAGFNVEG